MDIHAGTEANLTSSSRKSSSHATRVFHALVVLSLAVPNLAATALPLSAGVVMEIPAPEARPPIASHQLPNALEFERIAAPSYTTAPAASLLLPDRPAPESSPPALPVARPTEDPSAEIVTGPEPQSKAPSNGGTPLLLRSGADEVAPGEKFEVTWEIVSREFIPPKVKVEVRIAPPGPLTDGVEGAKAIGPGTQIIHVNPSESNGTATIGIPWFVEEPLHIQAELLLDGALVAVATLPVPLTGDDGTAEGAAPAGLLSSGVTVTESAPEGPHPWVNFENFTSNCPKDSLRPGTSGTCTASWTIYNDSNLWLSGNSGYNLALWTGSSSIPVYNSAETEICRKGTFNAVVSCTLHPVYSHQPYKAQHFLWVAPWSRTLMRKTIQWTLDSGAWWVASRSSFSSCGEGDPRKCIFSLPSKSQAWAGRPINTFTGGVDYPVEDLAIPTSAGPLSFDRSYSSLATSLYSTPLGYGWAHNQDIRLILEGDPGGQKGVVWLKAHTANQYAFLINADGSYTATSGVLATLTKQAGPPVTYTLTTEYNTQYSFAADKKLRTWTDAQGHTLSYTYDANGRLSQVSADGGTRYLTCAYSGQGLLASVADHNGRQVTYGYSTAGDLASATDVLGGTWTYTYNSLHRLAQVTDPRGIVVERTEYEGEDTPPINFNNYTITSFEGDANPVMTIEDGGLTLHIVGNGWKKISYPYTVTASTVLEFDFKSGAQGEVHGIGLDDDNKMSESRTFKLYGTQTWGIPTYNNYAPSAPNWKHYAIPVGQHFLGGQNYLFFANDHDVPNPTAESYFSNVRVYDSARAVRQFDGLGNKIVEIAYNSDGTTTLTDALGNVTTHAYDERRTLTGETDAAGGETAKAYDNNFRITSVTDPDGDTTLMTWSADGANLEELLDAEGGQTGLAYDSLNNLTSLTDARSEVTSYTYDGTLLTSTTDAEWNVTSYTYTLEGFLSTVTDAEGNTTSYTYNASGQRLSTTNALDETTTYAYDNLGRLVDTTDAVGRVIHNEYDAAGRLVRVTRNYDPARPQNDENQYNIVTAFTYDAVGNQIAATDTYGRTTLHGFDNAGQLISTTDPAGHSTVNDYDDAGNLLSTTDALGRTTSYEYDELGRLVSMEDPLGGVTGSAYDLDGTLTSTTDTLGHTTTYSYDDLKRVVGITDALGGVTQTVYDPVGNVLSTIDAEGNTTTFEYDGVGRLISEVDAEGGVTQHSYDNVGNRTETIDPRGHATGFSYDALGRLTITTDALGGTKTSVYDTAGNQTSVTDALGHSTSFTYDLLGRLITTTDALSHTSSSSYDALGNVVSRADPLGRATGYQYDLLARLTMESNPLGGQRTFAYDAVGNQVTATDENGHSTTTAYDDLNRPTVVTDANGNATTTAYDAVGNVVTVTDALDKITTYTYDALNRQTQITDPLGNDTGYGYDDVGNRASMTDGLGVVTRFEYDGLGRLTAVVENYLLGTPPDAETNVRTEYAYDENGNRVSILDGNGHETTFSYDWLNRSTSETDALGNTTSYAYDAVGSRTGLTDAMGYVTIFAYDDANRLITIDYPAPDADVSFTYDAASQRTVMVDGMGTTSWGYDALGRVTSVTDPFGGTVGYGYDAVGNRTALTYPDGKNVGYTYDPGDRLTQVVDWAMGVTGYSYDVGDRILVTTLPNAVTSTFTFDDAGRLLSIVHAGGGVTLASYSYTYNPVGNRVQGVEAVLEPGATPPATPVTIEYEYDPLGRLTAADYDSGPFFHYTHDPVGNRLTQVTAAGTNTYEYDIANRLTRVDGVSFAWDANGNLLDDGSSTYAYDHTNRLGSVLQGTDTFAFAYNGLGDRLQQTVNGVPTDYALDLNVSLTRVLGDGANTYLYGSGRIGELQPGGWQFHLADALGSVRQLANAAGVPTGAGGYEPFGHNLHWEGEASAFRYTGEQSEHGGLIYLRARYLHTSLGLFITRDTFRGDYSSPVLMGQWGYTGSNPVNRVDPSGHSCQGLGCRSPLATGTGMRPAHPYQQVSHEAESAIVYDPCMDHPAIACRCPGGIGWLNLPRLAGYFEGVSSGAGYGQGNVAGAEIVYDFMEMSRAPFRYTGETSWAVGSAELGSYAGQIFGFTWNADTGRRAVVDEYGGISCGWYWGASTIIGGGGFSGRFDSTTSDVWGVFSGVSFGVSEPVEIVHFTNTYTFDRGGPLFARYADRRGKVDERGLALDILLGTGSPVGAFAILTPPLMGLRLNALTRLHHMVVLWETYFQQHSFSQ